MTDEKTNNTKKNNAGAKNKNYFNLNAVLVSFLTGYSSTNLF